MRRKCRELELYNLEGRGFIEKTVKEGSYREIVKREFELTMKILYGFQYSFALFHSTTPVKYYCNDHKPISEGTIFLYTRKLQNCLEWLSTPEFHR